MLIQADGRRNVAHVRPFTEAKYEKAFAKALAGLGQFSYHTAERFYMGIPDRYVVGGRWIEFKQIKWAGVRAVSPTRQFSGPQIRTLDKFQEAGDETWVAVLFQTPGGSMRSMFLPWPMFRSYKPQWTPVQVRDRSIEWDGSKGLREQIIRSGFNAGQG